MPGEESESVRKLLLHILADKGDDLVTEVDEGLKVGYPVEEIEKRLKKTIAQLQDRVIEAIHSKAMYTKAIHA